MKKIISVILAVLTLVLCGCTSVPEQTGTDTAPDTATSAEATDKETEPETTEEQTTEPEPQLILPDYYITFSDENNIYKCSNLCNVTTDFTGDGMKIGFLPTSDTDETYCFDPYMTLPLPSQEISMDEYPFFVIKLYTSKTDLKGDIRFKTTALKNGASYPTYRFSYGEPGEQRIILDLRDNSVLFIVAGDSPEGGTYNDLRMDMFENSASTTDTFVIYWYAFCKTREEAETISDLTDAGKTANLPDLSAYYKGEQFVTPDSANKPKKLLYGYNVSYAFTNKKLYRSGYGGVVTNVNFNQNYLKDDAEFSLLSDAFKNAKENGLHVWIYDEYQWPSGKAFGQVLEDHEEFEATGIELIKLTGNGDIKYDLPDNYISIEGADLIKDGSRAAIDFEKMGINVKNSGAYTVYVYARRVTNQNKEDPTNFATLRDVDLLNPLAVARFIELTYEKYKDKLGETFDVVEAFFTDEPQLGNRDMKNYVVYSDGLPAKFMQMHGYSIRDNLYSLYDGDTEHDKLVRVNFYQTVAEMFRTSYFEQITQWCENNGVSSSGHMLFEENIQRQIETYGGDFLQLVGTMSIPGGDILHVEPEALMAEGTDIGSYMGLKYVYSAAKNAGKSKVHLEFTPSAVGGAPFFSAPGKYTIGGATLATLFGANTFSVICGDNDIPMDDLQKLTDYVGRINTLLETAHTTSPIAVFYPVDSVRAAFTADGSHFDYNGSDEAARINRLMQSTCYNILAAGLDYTVLDSQSIKGSELSGGELKIGYGEYSVIVMPRVTVIDSETLEVLDKFCKNGGTVIWLEKTPNMSGKANDEIAFDAALSKLSPTVYNGDLIEQLKKLSPVPMNASVKNGVLVAEYKREDDGKTVTFFANWSGLKKSVSVTSDATYYVYDPYNCTVKEATGTTNIHIQSYKALLIVQ